MRCSTLATAVLVTIMLSGCAGMAERRFRSQLVDRPAPDFELGDVDGSTVSLGALRGQTVLLAFFAHG